MLLIEKLNFIGKNQTVNGSTKTNFQVWFWHINSNYEEDSCLGEITFFPSTAREINDSIVPQQKPNDGDDILYFFENGQLIRNHCKEIELSVNVDKSLNLTISKDEALVLFDFLERFNETEQSEVFEDQAEQKTLWILEGQLEKQLVEPFNPDYKDIIKEARNKIRDGEWKEKRHITRVAVAQLSPK
jgi:hypothetical protein